MRTGLFSIGLDTYWDQFDGLLDNLNGYHAQIHDRIRAMGVEVIDAGRVDNPDKAQVAADLFKREDVEMIFLFISTYAVSSTVLPVVQRAKVPVHSNDRQAWACNRSFSRAATGRQHLSSVCRR